MTLGQWLILMAMATGGTTGGGGTEGNFDFVMATAPYSEPSGEGAFDFKVAI